MAKQLDALDMVRLLGGDQEVVRAVGNIVKCGCKGFCPLGKEQPFPPIMIDRAKRTYRCSIPNCPAAAGGTLLELWELHCGKKGPLALFDAVRKLQVPVDPGVLASAVSELRQQAQRLLDRGDTSEARAFAQAAFEQEPRNPDSLRTLARVAEASGALEEARERYVRAARVSSASRRHDRAISLLRDDALRVSPGSIPVLIELADAQESSGDAAAAEGTRLEIVEKYRAEGKLGNAQLLLEDTFRRNPSGRTSWMLAELLEQNGDTQKAMHQYLDSQSRFERVGDERGELRALRSACRLAPHRLDLWKRQAELVEEFESMEDAAPVYAAMGASAFKQDLLSEAEKSTRTAIERSEEIPGAWETLAEIALRRGRPEEAAGHWLRAAQLYQSNETQADVERCLELAVRTDPENPDAAAGLGVYHLARGEAEAGSAHLERAAKLYLRRGDEEPALGLAEGLAMSAGKRWPILESACRLLEELGRPEQAAAHLRSYAESMRASSPHEALEAARFAMRLAPGETDFLRIAVDAASGAKAPEDLAALARQLGEAAAAGAPAEPLREAFEKLLAADPHAWELRLRFADLLASQGDGAGAGRHYRELLQHGARLAPPERARVAEAASAAHPRDAAMARALALARRDLGEFRAAEAAFVRAAELADRAGDFATAIECLERAIAHEDPLAESLLLVAEANLRHGDLYRAQDLLDQFLTRRLVEGDATEQRAAFDRVLALDPGRPALRQRFARWLFERGQRDAGEEEFQRALALLPREGDQRERIAFLMERHALEPSRVEPLLEAAALQDAAGHGAEALRARLDALRAAAAAGEYEDALRAAGELRERHPDNEDARRAVESLRERAAEIAATAGAVLDAARAHQEAGELEAALAAYERALALDPHRADARAAYAGALEAAGDALRAAQAHAQAAALAEEAGDNAAARASLERAIAVGGPSRALRERLALVLLKGGDRDGFHQGLWELVEEARAQGDTASERDLVDGLARVFPDDAAVLVARADATAKLGKPEEAVRQLLEAAKAAGGAEQAVELLAAAARIDPSSYDAQRRLAHALAAAGRKEEALEAIRAVLRPLADEPTNTEHFELFDQARADFFGDAPRLLAVAASLAEHLGKPSAVGFLTRAAERHEEAELWGAHAELLGGIAAYEPHRAADLAKRAADSYEAAGEHGKAATAMVEVARGLAAGRSRLELLRKAAKLDPASMDALGLLWDEQRTHNDLEGAAETLAAFTDLAVAAGRAWDAERHLRSLLDSAPQNTRVRESLAKALGAAGNRSEAVLQWSLAAGWHRGAGRGDDARRCCAEALALEPDSVDANQELLVASELGGDGAEVARNAARLAALLVSKRRVREASGLLARIFRKFPAEPLLLPPIRHCAKELGEPLAASEAYRAHARALEAEGAVLDAADALRTARELDPDGGPDGPEIARLLAAGGDMEGAARERLASARAAVDRADPAGARLSIEAVLAESAPGSPLWRDAFELAAGAG
ncbi:MAG: tetratricopeptide repeat protein, partial [Candidatus Sumerlaeia bacterium]|nr:tetratricopeptide repeat protein [Candidatus Sumerlaeia bacterium]